MEREKGCTDHKGIIMRKQAWRRRAAESEVISKGVTDQKINEGAKWEWGSQGSNLRNRS